MLVRTNALTRSVGPFVGRGLFSGLPATVRFHPAPPGTGLRVRRLSFDQVAEAPLHEALVTTDTAWAGLKNLPPNVTPAMLIRNTTLRIPPTNPPLVDARACTLATVEHALAALAGLQVWDAVLEVDGAEVPILDGSAQDFVRELLHAIAPSPAPVRPLVLRERVEVRDEKTGASIIGVPLEAPPSARGGIADGCSYTLSFAGDPRRVGLAPATATWQPGSPPEQFARDIAPARTFSFEDEARAAQAMGMFQGLTPREMLVLSAHAQPIDNALRSPDEPARHKLLDLVGDLALLGAPLAAHVHATRSGHALTHAFCRAVRRSLGA